MPTSDLSFFLVSIHWPIVLGRINHALISTYPRAAYLYASANIRRLSQINKFLKDSGIGYCAKAVITDTKFKTKNYSDLSIPAGNYQALKIILGEGKGENWWCVAYPPLCFMYENVNCGNITYKSKLYEIISKFFKE